MPESNFWVWLLVVLIVALVAVLYFATRIRQVPEGFVAVVEKMEKFERTVGPGMYLLRPLEEEVTQVYVRQREAAESVPNVFTDGSLGVIVNLRYAYALDPTYMNNSEIYYTDDQRTEQQRTLLKSAFGEVMYKLSQTPTPKSAADRVDMLHLFSPFAGPKARLLLQELDRAVRAVLKQHGIIVSKGPIVINGLTLPPGVGDAYTEMLSTDFSSTARSDFIRRVRSASPGMSEAALIQLFNLIQNRSADMHTFFSGGMLPTQALMQMWQTSQGIDQPNLGNGGQGTNGPVVSGQGAQPASGSQAGSQPSQPAQPQGPQTPETPQTPPPSVPPVAPPQPAVPVGGVASAAGAAGVGAPAIIYTDPGCDPDYGVTEEDNGMVRSTRAAKT
jgi:hypothetical protein